MNRIERQMFTVKYPYSHTNLEKLYNVFQINLMMNSQQLGKIIEAFQLFIQTRKVINVSLSNTISHHVHCLQVIEKVRGSYTHGQCYQNSSVPCTSFLIYFKLFSLLIRIKVSIKINKIKETKQKTIIQQSKWFQLLFYILIMLSFGYCYLNVAAPKS